MSLERILTVLDRAHQGPLVPRRGWENGVITPTVTEKLRTYGLKDVFEKGTLVNQDDGLADDFFNAGFEVAVEAGRLCLDTERIVRLTDSELKDAVRKAPSKIVVGESKDQVTVESRRPEDAKEPKLCAPLAILVSEELWIPLVQGLAEVREVDILQGARLKTFMSHKAKSGTPYEVISGRVGAMMQREALRRAGREGLASIAVISPVTFLGQAGGYGTPGAFEPDRDIVIVLSPVPLKTTYDSLNKVIHAICHRGKILAGSSQTFGAKTDPPEGVALIAIASALLEVGVHQSSVASSGLLDVRYNGSCGREAVWASSVIFQALTRNTSLLTNSVANEVAGPCTKQLLYESAVAMMNFSVSGLSMAIGPRSGGGKFADHLTPLEAKLSGRVFKRCAGMKRRDANDTAKQLVSRYEDSLRQAPKGKSFAECYDVKKLKPSTEWQGIYDEVADELRDLGLSVDD